MEHSPALFTPALAEVHAKFADWRKNKKHRRRIPEDLWTAAVRLSPEHSLHKISTALSLSYTDLKKRVTSDKTPSATCPTPAFIPIDIPPTHNAECIVEMEHRNGNKMRMHFKGKADLDLQVFAESFWSRRA